MDVQHQPTGVADPAEMSWPREGSFDPSALGHLEALPEAVKRSLLDRLFCAFEHSSHDLVARMHEGQRLDDSEIVRVAAHTLKSSSAQIGAFALANLSSEIERLSAEQFNVDDVVRRVDRCYERTLVAIIDWRATE